VGRSKESHASRVRHRHGPTLEETLIAMFLSAMTVWLSMPLLALRRM
jgi:hypothetical protein